MIEAILDEAAKLARDVIAPLNHTGDVEGAVLENGTVRMPIGFADAWKQYAEGGWTGLPFAPELGGQGLPMSLAMAVSEIWSAANMSFGICPMLNQGAIEAIKHHGSEELKATYLEKMVSGQWVGTMNLTEPNAGSDLSVLRSRAVPDVDGSFRIKGSKIFISFGDHDMTENIIHLVLARIPDAPAGIRGVSLFIVPKFLVNEDGSLGKRNDVRCVSLEKKMGIHASPTCVMAFGDDDNCVGYLVGAKNKGLANMFTMMNNERLAVGIQGVAIGDRAYRKALEYAIERKQGKPLRQDGKSDLGIIGHADVRRMLMTMKSQVEAVRALAYLTAGYIDAADHLDDAENRQAAADIVEILTPVAKAWSTDVGCEVASIGVQVHGGLGFVEENGAAQYYRDARIAPIYEGTNGIQAMDLVLRKLPMKDGQVVRRFISNMKEADNLLAETGNRELDSIREPLMACIEALCNATEWMLSRHAQSPNDCAAGATPYLRIFGLVTGGYLLSKSAIAALAQSNGDNSGDEFHISRIAIAQFYANQIMPQSLGLVGAVMSGDSTLYTMSPEQMAN